MRGTTVVAAFLPFPVRLGRAGVGRTRPYVLATFGGLPLDFNDRLLVQPGPTVAAYISEKSKIDPNETLHKHPPQGTPDGSWCAK